MENYPMAIDIHTQTRTRTRAHVHRHTHIYTHTHTRTHTRTYTAKRLQFCRFNITLKTGVELKTYHRERLSEYSYKGTFRPILSVTIPPSSSAFLKLWCQPLKGSGSACILSTSPWHNGKHARL